MDGHDSRARAGCAAITKCHGGVSKIFVHKNKSNLTNPVATSIHINLIEMRVLFLLYCDDI